MSDKQRYPLAQMEAVAAEITVELAPYCERIEVAGSIRRRKPDVGDVEILCIPKPRVALLGGGEADELSAYLRWQLEGGMWELRPDANGRTTFGRRNKLMFYDGIPVDVFSTIEAEWGMSMVVRTGPGDWNVSMMAAFKQRGMAGHAYPKTAPEGRTYSVTGEDGALLSCPTEADVFRLLGVPYVEPEDRERGFPQRYHE